MLHCNPVLVTAVVLLMVLSTSAQLTIIATRDGVGLDNNRISLACRDSNGIDTTATFYRRVPHDGRELLIHSSVESVEFVIIINTEGSHFCNNSIGQSNLQEIVAFPSSLSNLNPSPGILGHPYTAECQYQFGLLSQYYSMTWTVDFSDSTAISINSNTTNYQLHGSSLTIATFTPLVESLACTLIVTGVPPFQGSNIITRRGFLLNIGVLVDTRITQSPQNYTVSMGGSAVFQCTACVPNQRTITFEIFGENITTADKSCTINSSIRTCNRVIDSHLVSLTCDYSTDYQINCTLSVDNVTRSSEVFCRVLNQSTIEAMERAAVLVVDLTSTGVLKFSRTQTAEIKSASKEGGIVSTGVLSKFSSLGATQTAIPIATFSLIGVMSGMATITAIFIASSIFLVILLVVVLYKHGRQKASRQQASRQPASRQQESTYEYIFSPPQLPPP